MACQEDLAADQIVVSQKLQAIAWRWGEYYPLPKHLDIAYRVRTNEWNGDVSMQLEIIGVRLPSQSVNSGVEFSYSQRNYIGVILERDGIKELRIRNFKGEVLTIQKGQKTGTLGKTPQMTKEVDVSQPQFYHLIKAAMQALGLSE